MKQYFLIKYIVLFVILSVLLLSFFISYHNKHEAQIRNAYMLDEYNFVTHHIDFPTDNLHSFSFLNTILSNVEIVMLGEQLHGDGSSHRIKIDLIKYLHHEMGFSVLAYEADFLDCANLWDSIKLNDNAEFYPLLYWFWCETNQTKQITDYIKQEKNEYEPLEVCGFDMSYFQAQGKLNAIKNFLTNKIPDFRESRYNTFLSALKNIYMVQYAKYEEADKQELLAQAFELKNLLSEITLNNRQDSIYCLAVLNIVDYIYYKLNLSEEDQGTFRDSIMAKNIIWLKENFYKDRKIIIWAANSHIIYNSNILQDKYKRMGDYVKEKYTERCYTINFTSYCGQTTNVSSTSIEAINDAGYNSVEFFLHQNGYQKIFIDYSNENTTFRDNTFLQKFLGHSNHKYQWGKMMDGFIFIDTMKPAQIIENRKNYGFN